MITDQPSSTIAPRRPIVCYHGGKWVLAPWIISHFPPHRIYVEPFGGGGSVLLRKSRCFAEIYNDLDGEIVNVFRVARDHGPELLRRMELTPFSRAEFFDSYEPTEDPIEQARRTIFRSFAGFGSDAASTRSKTGFRSNLNRSGTTPVHDWMNLPDAMALVIERLRGVVIEQRDATEVMTRHDREDALHYVDPPYVHSTRVRVDSCRGYRHEMTDEQHRTLAAFLQTLRGGVIVSGYACALYEELFAGWRRVERKALAAGARARTEVLWLRNIKEDFFSQ